MKNNALGIVEIQAYANALYAADTMLKQSDVELLNCEKKLGGRLVTIIVTGSVSSATEAVERVKNVFASTNAIKVSGVIANPSREILKFITGHLKE